MSDVTDEMVEVAALVLHQKLNRGPYMMPPDVLDDAMRAALAAVAPMIAKAEREACAAAAQKAWPKAHTYASENADIYQAQDHAVARVIAAIRARTGDAT